jgi:hypothetical protein
VVREAVLDAARPRQMVRQRTKLPRPVLSRSTAKFGATRFAARKAPAGTVIAVTSRRERCR